MVTAQEPLMNLSKIVSPAVVMAVLALAPLPAVAQHGGGGGGHGGGGGGHGGGGGGHGGGGMHMAGGSRGAARAAVPRGGFARGTAVPRGGYYGGGAYYRGYGGFGYALGAPYYAFRPRFGL